MNEGIRRTAANNDHRGTRAKAARPDRIAFWAFVLAIVAMLAAAATANAGSGGVGAGGGDGTGGGGVPGDTGSPSAKYVQIWNGFNSTDKRWAHRVSYCESGNNPRAVGGGGTYRGAFMFTLDAWKIPRKSPGGDPIVYPWKTQAVVAVLLKHKMGTKPWPVCG